MSCWVAQSSVKSCRTLISLMKPWRRIANLHQAVRSSHAAGPLTRVQPGSQTDPRSSGLDVASVADCPCAVVEAALDIIDQLLALCTNDGSRAMFLEMRGDANWHVQRREVSVLRAAATMHIGVCNSAYEICRARCLCRTCNASTLAALRNQEHWLSHTARPAGCYSGLRCGPRCEARPRERPGRACYCLRQSRRASGSSSVPLQIVSRQNRLEHC